MNDSDWLIYGATGYTGELIAREAVRRGHRPILAGRTEAKVSPLVKELACPARVFALDDMEQIAAQLDGLRLVLNCAGPFQRTARPLIEACITSDAHYLDITGELDVLEMAHEHDEAARQAGVALIPAVGFDVVPSDCLAAELAARLPDATHLELAIGGLNKVSAGTAKTMLLSLPEGGRVRIDGRIERVPVAWKTRTVPFRSGERRAVTIPWGDVSTAFYSTGIPNIEVYAAAPRRQVFFMKLLRPTYKLLKYESIRDWWENAIEQSIKGPNERARSKGRAQLWGEVRNAAGNRQAATLETPDGYQLTIESSLASVERVLEQDGLRGFYTPSKAFGREFIQTLLGCTLEFQT